MLTLFPQVKAMDYQTGFQDGYRVGVQMGQAMARNAMGVGAPMAMPAMAGESPAPAPAPKKKRKVSKYARAYGAAYKRLKKKHPRSKHATLVKRAHAEARRQMKK